VTSSRATATMLRTVILLLGIVSGNGATIEEKLEENYDKLLDHCDADSNGALNKVEFSCIFDTLMLTDKLAVHEAEYGDAYAAADKNNDNSVRTRSNEITDWLADMADDEFRMAIVMALIGVPDGGMEEIAGSLTPSDGMGKAEALVKLSFVTQADPGDYWPNQLADIAANVLASLGLTEINPEDIITTIVAGSANFEYSIFVPTAAQAAGAQEEAAKNLGTKEDASTALGVEVTDVPEMSVRASTPQRSSTTEPVIVAIVAVVLGIVTCGGLAKRAAKIRRGAWNKEYEGCCSTGICSAYALKGWAMGAVVAAIFLLACCIPTYVVMVRVASGIQCILAGISALAAVDAFAAVAEPLASPLAIVGPFAVYIPLLPIAVLIPVLLAAAWMIVTAICFARTTASMCCAKCFCLIDFVLLILSLVVNILFAALGFLITDPLLADVIKLVVSQCDALVPKLKGMVELLGAMTGARRLSEDPAQLVEDLKPAVLALESACTCVIDIIFSLGQLFGAGLIGTFASFYCIFVIYGLCCSAKCCKGTNGVTASASKVVDGA